MSSFTRPEVEVNTYRKKTPLTAKILENYPLIEDGPEATVHHIVVETEKYNYLEGQSMGVLPPGENEKGKPHNVRLYSIASLGNDVEGAEKLSLCIKRVIYDDPETGETRYGVASNYMCARKPGDEILITGPAGRKFLLPVREERNRPYLFFATGTGIAPFRGMIERLYRHTPGFNSPVYLFFGVRHTPELLYNDLFKEINEENFHYITSISREEKNEDGSRTYVHHKLKKMGNDLWDLLNDERTLLYICGLKGMEAGILESLGEIAEDHGVDANEFRDKISPRIEKEVY